MSRTMDYYELLGVDEDAAVNDIRAAYRDKKAAVADTGTDQAKAEAAALNKAWNVLSDPYQRGRYDQERANATEPNDDESDDDNDDALPAKRVAKPAKSSSRAESRRDARTPAPPTVKLPPGMGFPPVRTRRVAMFIDLAVLMVLFLASQFLVITLEKSQHAAVYKEVTHLNSKDGISKAHAATTAAKKKASANVNCATHPTAQNDKAYCDAKDAEKKLNDQLTHDEKILAPTSNLVSGLYFLLVLLILVVPSLFGGATLGKRLQHIRVVRIDGSPARAGDIFRRYAVLVFAAYVLTSFLRSPVGAVIVVFIASISRNPNTQALHDRFAKTLVVTDVDS